MSSQILFPQRLTEKLFLLRSYNGHMDLSEIHICYHHHAGGYAITRFAIENV
jgi:hypothetical protein